MPNKIKSTTEVMTFNGIRFYRYPKSHLIGSRRYFAPSVHNRRKGVRLLHAEIWKAKHGPIPKGSEIHHKDENPSNNDIGNLECLTKAQHSSRHYNKALRLKMLRWHRSPAGKLWHKLNGESFWKNRKPIIAICQRCKAKFSDISHAAKYCSPKCRNTTNMEKHKNIIGKYGHVENPCEHCKKKFTSRKWNNNRFCSLSCSNLRRQVLIRAQRLGGV